MALSPASSLLLLVTTLLLSWSPCRGGAAAADDHQTILTTDITPAVRPERPDWRDKAATARWMVHTIDYGVLSTLSSQRLDDADDGSGLVIPFGNVYSFVDGPWSNATGTPYFYGTYMDQSFADMKQNPWASLALTEASLLGSSHTTDGKNMDDDDDDDDDKALRKACSIPTSTLLKGDPENPVCARITLRGRLEEVPRDSNEFVVIQAAFFERHPQMRDWPVDHKWVIAKLVLRDLWLVDYYGGAAVIDPETYYGSSSSSSYGTTATSSTQQQ